MAYALVKAKICRISPHTLTDAQTMGYLISGLARVEHAAAMMEALSTQVNMQQNRNRHTP